jgi:hypothetical protein
MIHIFGDFETLNLIDLDQIIWESESLANVTLLLYSDNVDLVQTETIVNILVELIRIELNEFSETRITADDVWRAIEDGTKEVASRAFCIEEEQPVTVTDGESVVPFEGQRVNYVRMTAKTTVA